MWNTLMDRIQQGFDEAVDLLNEDGEPESGCVAPAGPSPRTETGHAEEKKTAPVNQTVVNNVKEKEDCATDLDDAAVACVVPSPEATAGPEGRGEAQTEVILTQRHTEGELGGGDGPSEAHTEVISSERVPLVNVVPDNKSDTSPPLSAAAEAEEARGELQASSTAFADEAANRTPASLSPEKGASTAAVATTTPSDTAAKQSESASIAQGAAEKQLLRFQEQLAEEMRNSSMLANENLSLKEELQLVREELAVAKSRILKSADMDDQFEMLINKLGREKERSKSLAEDRRVLREKVTALESAVENYKSMEEAWQSDRHVQQQSDASAHEHVKHLEEQLHEREAEADELREEAERTRRTTAILTSQLEEAKKAHSSAFEELRANNTDATEYLQREVDRLKATLARSTTESDARCADLEEELHQANIRSHHAETRLSDIERSSVGSLCDLRAELEDMQRRIVLLTSELSNSREKIAEAQANCESVQSARSAEEAAFREQLALQQRVVVSLTEAKESAERDAATLRDKAREAHAALAEVKHRCFTLEAANAQLKVTAAAEDANVPPPTPPHLVMSAPIAGSQSSSSSNTYLLSNRSQGQTSADNASKAGPALFRPAPLVPFSFSAPENSFESGAKTRARLENEIVRQAVEVDRLKKVEAEAAETKRQLVTLRAEHNVLLEMYGRMEEEIKRKPAAN